MVVRILIFILFIFPLTGWSQSGRGYFDYFGLSEGLSQSTVRAVYQDSRGLLWLGTEDGLHYFDGYSFRIFQHDPANEYSISNNSINCILEDNQGVIWVGTASGLNSYDIYKNHFKTYRYHSGDPHGISDNEVTALISAGDGFLWVGTRNGLNLLDTQSGKFKVFKHGSSAFSLSNSSVNALVSDPSGRIWCGTEVGLNLFDPADSTFLRFNYGFGEENAIPNPTVNALASDYWGNIWVGTASGIARVSADLEVIPVLEERIPEREGFKGEVSSLIASSNNLIWVATERRLMCLSEEGEVLSVYDQTGEERGQLAGGKLLALCEDKGGAIWIGTSTAGALRYTLQQQIFQQYAHEKSTVSDEGAAVWAFAKWPDNELVVGGSGGLFSVNQGDCGLHELKGAKKRGIQVSVALIRDMVVHRDLLYVATAGEGVYAFDRSWKLKRHYKVNPDDTTGIKSNKITALLPDSQGIWMASAGSGLMFLNDETGDFSQWKYAQNSNEGLIDNHLTALARDRNGLLWIGTANRGLTVFNSKTGRFRHHSFSPEKSGGISANHVTTLYTDNMDNLWIGTRGGGLNRLAAGDSVFRVFRAAEGLPANTISAITQDQHGALWISTISGIARYDVQTGDFRKFNAGDGLNLLGYNPGAVGGDGDSVVWFGGTGGVTAINPGLYRRNLFAPEVIFTGVSYTYVTQQIQKESSFFPDAELVFSLDPEVNTVSIEFAMPDLLHSEKNTYAYKVPGQIDDWVYIGNQRKITLAGLSPGKYSVQVKGANHDGVWNESFSELRLVKKPAFWQTGWFISLAILCGFLLVVMIYRWRISAVKTQNRLLESTVQLRTKEIARERDDKAVLLKEIHHRVKNNLQIISSLLSLQSRLTDRPEVEELFTESVNRVRSMSMIHEKMYRSENLREISASQYLGELLSTLVSTYGLNLQIETEVKVEAERFTVDTLTPLGLIINELVTNSLKYAFEGRGRGRVFLHLRKGDEGTYHMFLGDDGIGFGEEDVRSGAFGTELAHDLAAQLQGTLEKLPSEEGTVFHLIFKDIDNQ